MFFEQRTLSICWFSGIWLWGRLSSGIGCFLFFCWGGGGCRIALWGSELPWVYCVIFINKTLLTFPPKSYPMYRYILASGDLCPLPRRKRETRELNRSTQWMGDRAQARASASSCTKQVFKPPFFFLICAVLAPLEGHEVPALCSPKLTPTGVLWSPGQPVGLASSSVQKDLAWQVLFLKWWVSFYLLRRRSSLIGGANSMPRSGRGKSVAPTWRRTLTL